ncbi:MAG TPA: flagellar basal body-associated FliL family protein [Synergistetes bacterium]|nr:flagellar basal body-associated FliL family protein [Synergistota bacterium]
MKPVVKKAIVVTIVLASVFLLGFAGGVIGSGMMAGRGEDHGKADKPRSYPIFDLGEFKLSLAGGKYTDSRMVSFELVLELQNQKFLEKIGGDDYWKALFRNEIISESMSQGIDSFQSPEGFLRLSEAFARRINAVTPEISGGEPPVRRILFRSMIIQ